MVNMNGELEWVITGMDCADCALTLQKSVERLDGVQVCSVNLASGRMRVRGSVAVVAVSGTVTALGYGVLADNALGQPRERLSLWLGLLRSPRNVLTLAGMVLIALAFAARQVFQVMS